MLDMVGDPTLLIEAYSRTGRVRVLLPAALTVFPEDALDETYCFIFFVCHILHIFVPGAQAVIQT